MKIICHNCNSILSPGTVFCPQCGSRITEADYVPEETVQVNPIYLQPGTVLHLKYRINGVIGQGGFGITYDGTDTKLDMHVAIKEYFPNTMASREITVSTEVICGSNTQSLYEQGMNNFLKEARNMAKYAGEENFVAVHDYFAENNTAYIIMEFVEGRNLKEYLKQHGRLTMEEAMPIILPVMNTLEKIHGRNMIHRDVSPSNIMITPDGRVRLLDFGAAREVQLDAQNLTTMSAVYKYGYSPIEQQTMGMKQGPYTDIYALCATIYEMLTGTVPPNPLKRAYEGDQLVPPSRMGVRISPVQEDALLRGLAVNGADRIQTIAELRDALCRSGGQYGAGQYGAGGGQYGAGDEQYGTGGNKALKVVLAIAAAVLVAVLGVAVYLGTRPKNGGSSAGASADPETIAAAAAGEETPQETSEGTPEETEVTDQTQEEVPAASGGAQAEAVTQAGDWKDDGSGSSESGTDEEDDDRVYPTDQPDRVFLFRGHSYGFYDARSYGLTSYSEVARFCREQGGHLAVINDSAENEYLFGILESNYEKTAFFGYSDELSESDWRWEGDSSDYENWTDDDSQHQPDNGSGYGGDEDYAEFNYERNTNSANDGTWNDAPFMRNTDTFICEWEYELE